MSNMSSSQVHVATYSTCQECYVSLSRDHTHSEHIMTGEDRVDKSLTVILSYSGTSQIRTPEMLLLIMRWS